MGQIWDVSPENLKGPFHIEKAELAGGRWKIFCRVKSGERVQDWRDTQAEAFHYAHELNEIVGLVKAGLILE